MEQDSIARSERPSPMLSENPQPTEGAVASDAHAINRGLPIVTAARVPNVPRGYVALNEGDARALQRFPEENRAEGVDALTQYATRLEVKPGALGDTVAEPALARALATRIQSATDTIAALGALLAYHTEQRALAENDATVLLKDAQEEIDRRVRKGLARSTDWSLVTRFTQLHGDAVVQGLARARQAKAKKDADK